MSLSGLLQGSARDDLEELDESGDEVPEEVSTHSCCAIRFEAARCDQEEEQDADMLLDSLQQTGVQSVAKLMRSDRMVALLKRIGELMDPETGESETQQIERDIKVSSFAPI